MKIRRLTLFVGVACSLAGCAHNVYFTTSSSIGLDVSGTAQVPNKISFAFQRFEGAIVPNKSDGSAHSVLGKLEADPFTWFSGQKITQLFATGEAAINAAEAGVVSNAIPVNIAVANPVSPVYPGDDKSLVFVTRTTIGLDLSAGEPNISPHLLLGYKRLETSAIPIPDPSREVRPVYANFLIDTHSADTDGAVVGVKGVKIVQAFATGKAAVLLSRGEAGVKLRKAVADVQVQKEAVDRIIAAVKDANGKVDKAKLKALAGSDPMLGQDPWLDRYAGKDVAVLQKDLTSGPYAGSVPQLEKNLPQ